MSLAWDVMLTVIHTLIGFGFGLFTGWNAWKRRARRIKDDAS